MFTQSRQNDMLDGGETKRFEERAATTLPPGSYVAVATLHSTNYPVRNASRSSCADSGTADRRTGGR